MPTGRTPTKYLPEIRQLLLEGKNVEAEALVNAQLHLQGPGFQAARQYGCYQVLGNLHLIIFSRTPMRRLKIIAANWISTTR